MLVTIDHAGRHRMARLEIDPGATVSDLARALATSPSAVTIDHATVEAHQRLIGIVVPGSHIGVTRPGTAATAGPPPDETAPTVRLVVCGGLHSGTALALEPGRWIVGRRAGVHLRIPCPTVSPDHLVLTHDGRSIRMEDLGTCNGTRAGSDWVAPTAFFTPDVVITIGAHRLRLDMSTTDRALVAACDDTGRRIFDRPPRPPLPPPTPPVRLPHPPASSTGGSAFSWSLFLGPLAVGAVLATFVSPALAVFALLSPVLTVANWLEGHRRSTRGRRRDVRRYHDELLLFRADLARVQAAERQRRRVLHPDPAEVAGRALTPAASLWQRRPSDPDWLHLRLGAGSMRWEPPLTADDRHAGVAPIGLTSESAEPGIAEALADHRTLADTPVTVDGGGGRVIGVVGSNQVVSAFLRSVILDAVVHHGPADLSLAIDSESVDRWAWTTWLPHAEHRPGASDARPRHVIVVTDREGALRPGRPARRWLDSSSEITLFVLAETAASLPSACHVVIEATDAYGSARMRAANAADDAAELLLDGIGLGVAERVSRALAALADSEVVSSTSFLPGHVTLVDDLATPATTEAIQDHWDRADPAAVGCPIGLGPDGPIWLDLDRHGPHLLVAGTTGSGKSELLRTLIIGLSTRHPPEALTFMLVDYKGGSAFDACVDLPHTVGVVTDLDGSLGRRAIRSLDAEIRRRERLLREAGFADLATLHRHRSTPGAPAVTRLVIVVDEFAVLARESPAILSSLVDVAQRGRSLGLHLVLATQRPAGVVNDQIRTNAGTRIALRVVDPSDSTDVLGTRHAAAIPSSTPGRAFVVTDGPPTEVQIAFPGHRPRPSAPVEVDWLDEDRPPAADESTTTDLERLVHAVAAAGGEPDPAGRIARHRPWLEPLPAIITADEALTVAQVGLGADEPTPPGWMLGVGDDPDHQRRRLIGWSPTEGPLLLYGMPGSGCTTALSTIACSAASSDRPPWTYVVGPPTEWDDARRANHVGEVIAPDDGERLTRLVTAARRHLSAIDDRPLLLLIDGIRPAMDALEAIGGLRAVEELLALLGKRTDRFGVAAATDRVSAMPGALASIAPRKLVFCLPDPYEYSTFGVVGVDDLSRPPGRAHDVASGLEVQVLQPPTAVFVRDRSDPPLAGLDALPTEIRLAALGSSPTGQRDTPLALADDPREPVGLPLRPGETTLIAGPDGTGRTTACATLAAVAEGAGREVVATGPARSDLAGFPGMRAAWCEPAALEATLRRSTDDRLVLIVDDAELVDDEAGTLPTLLRSPAGLHLVFAVHPDRLRSRYGHWVAGAAPSPQGLALRPDPLDGELWSTTLPRTPTAAWPPGRGYLVQRGRPRLAQIAVP